MIEQFIEWFINDSYSNTHRHKKGRWTKKIKWHVDFAKTKNNLIMQIQIKKIELTKLLHERKISKIDHSNCLCKVDEQTSKHVIMNCVLMFDTFDIWSMIKMMNEKHMENLSSISK